MPQTPSRPSQLPISNIRVVGADALSERQLVYCQRQSASVPIGRCIECRHFQALEPADDEHFGAVVCDEAPLDVAQEASLTLPRLSAGDLMTRDVLCVRPELSLDAAALLLLEHPGKTVPVVDDQGHVLGTLCDAELQVEIQAERSEQGTVLNAMTPYAVTVPEATPITRAAAVMAFEGISCLVVVSPAGAVVGVLTASDLLAWLACADGYLPRFRRCAPQK